ncbi:unnamed protein product, partial [Fusarium graminearum]
WDEDELQVEGELNELRRVFNLYGFTTTKFRIPTSNSHRKLNQKVLSFVEEHENEDALLVIYYGGHGIINKARQSTWSCAIKATLQSSGLLYRHYLKQPNVTSFFFSTAALLQVPPP